MGAAARAGEGLSAEDGRVRLPRRLRHAVGVITVRPLDGHLRSILAAFDLGSRGRFSDGPVASGRLGAIWRLDTDRGSWAVKQVGGSSAEDLTGVLEGAAFQEAALAAGIPTPMPRRTSSGEFIYDGGEVRVRLCSWVDLADPDPNLDPLDVGRLVAGLHRVEFAGTVGLDAWYTKPVGEARWLELLARLSSRQAPFVDELAALIPQLVVLEGCLGGPPRDLRTCHRDLWADNVRRTGGGELCVFDFDNAGLADPSQELAAVMVEYCGDRSRTRALQEAYEEAGGPGRVQDPTDFAMAIAQLDHIVAEGCRRWLMATTDDERGDNESWVREFIDRPLTLSVIHALLDE